MIDGLIVYIEGQFPIGTSVVHLPSSNWRADLNFKVDHHKATTGKVLLLQSCHFRGIINRTIIPNRFEKPLIKFVALIVMRREYLPLQSLPAWAKLNGISTNGVAFQNLSSTESEADKGNAIVATEEKSSRETDSCPQVLLQIPRELVLSLEAVQDYSKSDRDLREVLEAVGDFGRVCSI